MTQGMPYAAYRRQTEAVARAIGGDVVSLAGGYYGAAMMADGARVIVAMDFDACEAVPVWVVWAEAADGETCCDRAAMMIGGTFRPREFALLREAALGRLLTHRCA